MRKIKYILLLSSLLSFQCLAEKNKIIHHKIHQITYHGIPCYLKASYPTLSDVKNKNATLFNQTILTFITETTQNYNHTCKPQPKDYIPYSLTIDYKILNNDNHIVSAQLYREPCAPCAHPNVYFKTFNYDLIQGKMLKLSDLFEKNSPYLNEISGYCRKVLSKKFPPDTLPAPDTINRGTTPIEKNFDNWNLSPKGLVIAFNSQQVASYGQSSDGNQVIIPFDQLKDLNLANFFSLLLTHKYQKPKLNK